MKLMDIVSAEKQQFFIYLAIVLGVLACAVVVTIRNPALYAFFIGRLNPLLIFILISILGFLLLALLMSRGWFAIWQPGNIQGLLVAAGAAVLFAIVIVLFDTQVPFPADVNRPYPDALFFYPSIAFAVEILFHVLPLTLLLFGITALFKNTTFETIIWPCILLVALIEPVFQTVTGSSGTHPGWATAFVAAHIFLINLVQLALFKRYDFVSMYTYRLAYYALWHILWGVVRLRVLF
jgi:hypothetical protein